MPQLRSEQIKQFDLSDMNIAFEAAIKQSKIADYIADPNGWISKGTITPVDSFDTATSGYQELGLSNVQGSDGSNVPVNFKLNIMINGTNYVIDTNGETAPISFDSLIGLINTQISGDGLLASITGGDVRISNTSTGYDSNVSINPNAPHHRLLDFIVGFSGLEEPVQGSGVNWDGSQAGRMFFSTSTNEVYIGISTDPYYQALGGNGGFENKITVVEGSSSQNWDGTTGTIFRSANGFAADASNVFVYLNGQLLEYNPNGTDDYQVSQGNGTGGEYTDVVLNSSFTVGEDDKVTIIVYENQALSNYATKAYVDNKLTGNIELTGDTEVGGNVIPTQAALFDLGTVSSTWSNIYLDDSIYFKPVGSGDNLRIYRNVSGADTQLRFQIGTSSSDKFVFEDENNTEILSIDGDGNVNIPGDLNVTGTTTYIDETNSQVSDADFIIKESVPASDGNASYQVQRASGNVALRWNDSTDRWQATYGSSAGITSNILTENDLASGINLDSRYLNESNLVFAGSPNTNSVIEYAGSFTSAGAPGGVFYGGTYKPDNNTRLNYNGDLYVNALHADDVYVSASSLYVNGKKVIEEDSDVMTFRADPDQSIRLQTLGIADIDIQSQDEINAQADGGFEWNVTDNKTNKHINFNNASSGGNITFATIGSGGVIQIQAGGPSAAVVSFDTTNNNPTGTERLNMDGYFYATRVYNAVYNDLAEFMPKAEHADPGQVMIMTEKGIAPSKFRGDGAVVGVYSDTFGQALGADDQENKIPVGLSGRVDVWVKEPVKIGDLLISDEGGFATVKRSGEDGDGKVIGKVMVNKTDSDPERISMLIMMK